MRLEIPAGIVFTSLPLIPLSLRPGFVPWPVP